MYSLLISPHLPPPAPLAPVGSAAASASNVPTTGNLPPHQTIYPAVGLPSDYGNIKKRERRGYKPDEDRIPLYSKDRLVTNFIVASENGPYNVYSDDVIQLKAEDINTITYDERYEKASESYHDALDLTEPDPEENPVFFITS